VNSGRATTARIPFTAERNSRYPRNVVRAKYHPHSQQLKSPTRHIRHIPSRISWRRQKSRVVDRDHLGELLIRVRNLAESTPEILNRGTFRQTHWVKVKAALSSGIPDEVKEIIKRFNPSDTGSVYVARAEQLRLDLELLGCLAQLAGALQGEFWHEVRQQIDRGMKLFDTVWRMDILPADPGRTLGPDDEADEPTPQVAREKVKRAKHIGKSALRTEANVLFSRAFDRGLGKLDATYWYRGAYGPGLRLRATSIQTTLYLTLLANLNREWRKCKREDCDVVFQLGRREDKVYCTTKCAHLDNMRSRRARPKPGRDQG
jgi:hypothetical protein